MTGTRAPSAVVIEGAVKYYGDKPAIDQVSLTAAPGTLLVLLGPSGSGKTTLVRCVAGIEQLSAGRLVIADRIVDDGTTVLPPERRDLGMVFQDYALWPHLTALENVAYALGRRRLTRRDAERRSREMLDRVGLGRLADRYPNQLSGGEQQRVSLARALVANTGLLLFDEPLSNLDANLREQMRVEIATLARESEATSIYITHDQAEAFALADVIGVLQQGRLVQLGTPEDLYHRPASPFVARFTGLAGELGASVEGAAGEGTVWLRVDDVQGGPRVSARAAHPLRTGDRARLLLRPSAVRLTAPDDPAAPLRARICDAAFRGRGYDYAVLFDTGGKLVGIHDERRWERGAVVGLRMESTGCLAFAEASADGDAPPVEPSRPPAEPHPLHDHLPA